MPGPPPKHPSARRRTNAVVPMTRLPASGYDGPIPRWPLSIPDESEVLERELFVWGEVWRTPQAAAWARLGWTHEVAMYVRYLVAGEATTPFGLRCAGEARLAADRIGMNPVAMQKLRWEVAPDENATVHELQATGTSGSGQSARARAAALGVRPVGNDEVEDDED